MALIQNFSEAKDKIFYLTSAESKILADQIREVKILDKIRVGAREFSIPNLEINNLNNVTKRSVQ